MGDTVAVMVSWLAEDEPRRFEIDWGWFALVGPIAVFALTAIVRAFTAQDRVRQGCAERVTAVKDAVLSVHVHPALATIVVKIYPYFPDELAKVIIEGRSYLPGQPGDDPELEATRILGIRTSFADSLSSLEEHYGTIHRANSAHSRIVAHQQRHGIAMGVFFVSWLYIGCYLMLPNFEPPTQLSICVLAVLFVSLGWAACEWWDGNRVNNALTTMAWQAQQTSTGQTS